MNEFLKMDIFFAVTTITVVIVGILVCVVLVYVARFLRTANRIATEVEEETSAIRADLSDMRDDIKRGLRFVPLFTFFRKTAKRLTSTKKKSKTK
jgi:predicted RND superfamily exporter protein